MQSPCPVCERLNAKFLYPVSEGGLVRCHHCKLVFYTPLPTPQDLMAFYGSEAYRESYLNSEMVGDSFAVNRYQTLTKSIQRYASFVLPGTDKQLLDVGCGAGDLLKVAASRGWCVAGTEISVAAMEQVDPELQFKIFVGDVLSLDLPAQTYDVITMYHLIEHLLNPIETLSRIHGLLRSPGIVFIETPNLGGLGARIRGKHWSNIKPPEHITYFERASLEYALRQAGFKRFNVFSSSPQVITSASKLPPLFRSCVTAIYQIAPSLGLGAALQAIAFKE